MSSVLICLYVLSEDGIPRLQLRHWLALAGTGERRRTGCLRAGAGWGDPWEAAIVGAGVGLTSISGTWRVIAPASGLVAVVGLSTWMMGLRIVG
jgi:hypothetical protein